MSLNEKTGIVVSRSGKQTISVSVESLTKHLTFGKYVRRTGKFLAHDGRDECGVGDTVIIRECRPLSARKRWRVIQVLEKSKEVKSNDSNADAAEGRG